ncbi:MAG: hypothetical protein ACOZNI_06305 [Myxococcota bacterium]
MRSWHATWSSEGRHPLAPTEARRLALVRAIGRIAGKRVALFCIVDDHVHLVLFCEERELGRLVQALTFAFRPLAAVPLAAAFVRRVRDRGHMEWLADEYILKQAPRHGLPVAPATWSGSCFPDLVGARVVPGLRLCIGDALPRWRLRNGYRAVGLPEVELEPASDATVRAFGASRLAAAAASATCALPTLAGKGAPEVLARRAATVLGERVGVPVSELAFAFGMTPIATARLRSRHVADDLLKATRVRVSLELAAAAVPLVAREPPPPEYEA